MSGFRTDEGGTVWLLPHHIRTATCARRVAVLPQEGSIMFVQDPEATCACCHSANFDVVPNDRRGFVVICDECGYAQALTLAHLRAS